MEDSLGSYKSKIESTLDTYKVSVALWRKRRETYTEMLETWQEFSQLRSNPIDSTRLKFIDAEIVKQEEGLVKCEENLKKFMALEIQMRELAGIVKGQTTEPSLEMYKETISETSTTTDDDQVFEIREDLDDEDNIISVSVSPQNVQALDALSEDFEKVHLDHSEEKAEEEEEESCTESGHVIDGIVEARKEDGHVEIMHIQGQMKPAAVEQPSAAQVKPINTKKKKKSKKSKKNPDVSNQAINILPYVQERSDARSLIPLSADGQGTSQVLERQTGLALEASPLQDQKQREILLEEDLEGYSIGVVPAGVVEMSEIIDEMDWGGEDEEDEDEEEDEFGRSKGRGSMIPIYASLNMQRPGSAQEHRGHLIEVPESRPKTADPVARSPASAGGKKRLIFAEDLVQGPSTSSGRVARSVLKKQSAYPFTEVKDNSIAAPIIAEPKKPSRFKMERSSTDSKISLMREIMSQSSTKPMASTVVERQAPSATALSSQPTLEEKEEEEKTIAAVVRQLDGDARQCLEVTTESQDRLFPKKLNLANQDLAPEDGVTKRPLMVRRLTDDEMAVIRKKRELLGKKNHKRRKSADPNYPVRSNSYDEPNAETKDGRSHSSGELDKPDINLKDEKAHRVKELLRAQDDIAWANEPITPEETLKTEMIEEPLAITGEQLPDIHKSKSVLLSESINSATKPAARNANLIEKFVLNTQEPNGVPVKAPTPERKNSATLVPSPLSQEITNTSEKNVSFSEDVKDRLEGIINSKESALPNILQGEHTAPSMQKGPPLNRQPKRQSSIDPITISPTPRSPPPRDRDVGAVDTEGDRALHHTMVRSTAKSPPPHIAIHDLLGETPEYIREAVRTDDLSPTPTYGQSDDSLPPEAIPEALSAVSKNQTMASGIIERDPVVRNVTLHEEDEIDDEMHRKEIAQEYHRLRSRMIQRQGGFVKPGNEEEIVPLEEDLGPGKRISRFKAARLR